MTTRRVRTSRAHDFGFTLVEAVMVIVITGIIAAITAVFIRSPVEGYIASVRRAELTDDADVALRRFARDVRLALPNSLRVSSGVTAGINYNYIEFIMTSGGGRYREQADGSTGGDFVSFTSGGDTTFDVLLPLPSNPAIAAGDYIVVFNLGTPYSPVDAYNYDASSDACRAGGCNIAKVSSVVSPTVTLTGNPFAAQSPPLPSPSSRFQVVPGSVKAVTFACRASSQTPGDFTRYWNYGFNTSAPTAAPGGTSAVMAANATCDVSYAPAALARNGLLSITLTLTHPDSNESVSLFRQIHVDNSP